MRWSGARAPRRVLTVAELDAWSSWVHIVARIGRTVHWILEEGGHFLDTRRRPTIPCRCGGCALMRRVLLGALLVVMTFSGVRVICVAPPEVPSHPVARVETVSDCERLCPLHPAPGAASESGDRSDTERASDCALSVDGATMTLVVTTVVSRPQVEFPAPVTVTASFIAPPPLYVEPTLAHLAPPPKPQVR